MWKEQAFQMWYLWKMLAFEDMSYYQMKVKVFQLWHLWQVVTLEDIFSYFKIEKVLYAIVVKNISLCMHIFLFREGISLSNVISMENVGFAFIFCHFMMKKIFKCDVCEKY